MHNHNKAKKADKRQVYFLRNEQPSVKRAFPPVGWQRTVEHPAQMTTVCACEKTVVIVKQPGHFTSIKKDRGAGTRVYRWQKSASNIPSQMYYCYWFMMRTLSLCLRASAAGVGLRRSTARTYAGSTSLAYILSIFPYPTIGPISSVYLYSHLNDPEHVSPQQISSFSNHFCLGSSWVECQISFTAWRNHLKRRIGVPYHLDG
jgi:hypothetical protein